MPEHDIRNSMIDDAAKAMAVQRHQQQALGMRTAELRQDAIMLNDKRDALDAQLDDMLAQAEALCRNAGLDPAEYDQEDIDVGESMIQLSEAEIEASRVSSYAPLEVISFDDAVSWDEYMGKVGGYAEEHSIDLTGDVLTRLLTKDEIEDLASRIRDDYTLKEAHCDQYEYALAAFCGVVTGLVDSFFVGKPGDSRLGDWVDKRAEDFVQAVAKKLWDKDEPVRDAIKKQFNKDTYKRNWALKEKGIPYNQNLNKRPETLQQCIQYLENKYKVCYDATDKSKLEDANGKVNGMCAGNHHMFSLAHAPDIIGLFFSILDQFTGKGTYISGGKLVRLKTVDPADPINGFELRGSNFIAKIFCGVANWIGHCISDLVGSSGTAAAGGRGTGLPAPGLELFQFITASVGKGDKKITIAQLSLDVFEKGYDARFYAAASIPVVLNDLLVRLCFVLKRYFYNGLSINECIPVDWKVIRAQPELRRMLLVSQGTFCIVDGVDAAVRSHLEILEFAIHLNFPAWKRLAFSGLIEIRRYFDQGALDVIRLDEDLKLEWERMLALNA